MCPKGHVFMYIHHSAFMYEHEVLHHRLISNITFVQHISSLTTQESTTTLPRQA